MRTLIIEVVRVSIEDRHLQCQYLVSQEGHRCFVKSFSPTFDAIK
jgi:hypothetical protein